MKKLISKHRFVSAVILIAVLVGGYFGFTLLKRNKAVQLQYVTAKAAVGTLVISVSGSGQIAASNQINLQPRISGTVLKIPVQNNQSVKADDLLIELDPSNEERALRNAQASFDNAQLALATLLEPPTTSTILQAQQSVVQAQQSLQTAQRNLTVDYSDAYTDISNTFIDLPGVMSGLNAVIYSTALNKSQADIDALNDLVSPFYASIVQYTQNAKSSYETAFSTYNQSLADFKQINIDSSTSTVESFLAETYTALKLISVANTNVKNFLDVVNNQLQQYQQSIPSRLTLDVTNMESYISTINGHLTTILSMQNSLENDKKSIVTANLSVAQTQASWDQLQSGPTELSVKQQQLTITQAQNSLTDAKQNLDYDYVRAPFDGVVTSITAKVGQPLSGGATAAVLVGNTQLAQLTLNEVDVVNVKVGQPATVTFDALPGLTLTGKVSQVDTLGTVQQGVVSYNVQVALDIPNDQIKPGMSDNVSIITNAKQDALLVPNSAVTTRQNVSTIQVLDVNGQPMTKQVTVGLSNDTETEILSGLNEGDAVVTKTVTSGATQTTPTGGGGFGGLRIFGGGAGR